MNNQYLVQYKKKEKESVLMIAMACTGVIVDRYSNQSKFSDIYTVFNYYTQYPFARFLISVFQFQINMNLLPYFVRMYQV
jgi:hypothetical protein